MKKNLKEAANSENLPSLKMIEAMSNYGSVKISEKVITTIIRKAACKVPGVSRLAPGTFVESITNMICSSKISDSAVKLDISENSVTVHLRINVAYGHNISEVAMKVQNTIADEVRLIIGMNVKKVDVEVQEVETSVSV